jgi:hypothetical protein
MPAIDHLQRIQSLRPACLPSRENTEHVTEGCPLRGICQSRLCLNTNADCSGSPKGN